MAYKSYISRKVAEHSDTDRKNSWYWFVLKKNYGSMKAAEDAVFESRKKADLFLDGGRVFKLFEHKDN